MNLQNLKHELSLQLISQCVFNISAVGLFSHEKGKDADTCPTASTSASHFHTSIDFLILVKKCQKLKPAADFIKSIFWNYIYAFFHIANL